MAPFLGTLFIVVCILLILVVLLQKGRGGGLGAAFGGAGSSAFGTKTGDVLTWVTIVLTGLFLLLAIGTTLLYRPEMPEVKLGGFNPLPNTRIDRETTVQVTNISPRNATVRYTLDGGEPTEDSPKYTKIGVRVKPGQTLKVRGYRGGHKPSEIKSATYPLLTNEPPEAPKTPEKPKPGPESRPSTKPAPTSAPAPTATRPSPASRPASTTRPTTTAPTRGS